MSRVRRRSRKPRVTGRRFWRGWLFLGSISGLALVGAIMLLFGGRLGGSAPPEPATGTASAAVAIEPPEIDLGRVPLGRVVPVQARVVNHSQQIVSLGNPTVETLEGC